MKKNMKVLFFIGRIFSPLYSLLMKFRAFLYQKDFLKRTRLSVPVISVGNLTMGGTGKTPMVLYIAKVFEDTYKMAVVSRGYGGKARKQINLVSDGSTIFLSSEEAGDEPRLLAESLPGVSVLTGAQRVLTAQYAVDKMKAQLVVMDDGFQHMALRRDCNLVLFAASELLGSGWVCPGGPLREPFSALKRADAFVITGVDVAYGKTISEFVVRLAAHFPAKPVFQGRYKPVGLQGAKDNKVVASKECRAHSFLAFCGIATPESFQNSLAEEALVVNEFMAFRDHHSFTQADMDSVQRRARQTGCDALLTTAKDSVKLQSLSFQMPLWVLKVELEMEEGFIDYLLRKVA